MEMSKLMIHKPEQIFQNSHRIKSPTMYSSISHQQTQLSSSSLAMLPDDHWNDIELISFGLHDTHLTHQNNVISADVNGSIVHYAASNNYIDLLKKLITTDKTEIDSLDQERNTPLLLASSVGNSNIVKFLLGNNANINAQNQFDNSSLHESAWRGFSQTLQILCQYKPKLHLKNRQGHTALHLAAQKGHNQCCRILLLSGCKPNVKNNFGDTPLHSALRYGHVGVVRILISAFANVNELNKNDDTSLHIAAAMGRKKLAKILLESGCNPTIANKQGETPMNIALRKSFLEIQELIANPPPLKPIYLKQQELYNWPHQGSYKDIYCALPKSPDNFYDNEHFKHKNVAFENEDLYYSKTKHHQHNYDHILSNEHHKVHHSNRRFRSCKSDYSNGYLASTSGLPQFGEKQSSSVSKYYSSMLRKLGGASPLEQTELLSNGQDMDTRSASPNKTPQLCQQTRRNREFVKPKLETLPKEPLVKGEQYFVDLSGHIHKGQIPPGPDMEPLINSSAHHKTKLKNNKK